MTYVWNKPDGTQEQIDSAEPISRVLEAIESQWSSARDGGKRTAEASLWASHLLQKREWQQCQRAVCQQQMAEVDELIDLAGKREAWWNEFALQVRPESGLSPAQEAIFIECDDAARPQTWQQAALALTKLEEFRRPAPDKLPGALQANADVLIKAKAFRDALFSMVEVLGEIGPTPTAWKELQRLGLEYDQAVHDAALA